MIIAITQPLNWLAKDSYCFLHMFMQMTIVRATQKSQTCAYTKYRSSKDFTEMLAFYEIAFPLTRP